MYLADDVTDGEQFAGLVTNVHQFLLDRLRRCVSETLSMHCELGRRIERQVNSVWRRLNRAWIRKLKSFMSNAFCPKWENIIFRKTEQIWTGSLRKRPFTCDRRTPGRHCRGSTGTIPPPHRRTLRWTSLAERLLSCTLCISLPTVSNETDNRNTDGHVSRLLQLI